MKKLFFLSAAAIVLTATVNAQVTPASLKSEIKIDKKVESTIKKEKKEDRKELRKLKGKEVSYQAKQAFAMDFAGVTSISAKRLDNFDKFTFSKDGQTMSAYYDYDSKLVGIVTKKSFSDLPAHAKKYIGENYAGYTPVDVLMYDDNEFNETDMVLYGYQFEDEDSYFVELVKDNKKIVVQVGLGGDVSYFTRVR